jgi:hypothetical protein
MHWDDSLHNQVGNTFCGNSDSLTCPTIGFVRHLGHKFSPLVNPESLSPGLPITANPDIVGLSGGFGWLLDFDVPAPRSLRLERFEIDPASPLIVSIPYPVGTTFEITANGPSWCGEIFDFKCRLGFTSVTSIDVVRTGRGDGYYVDPDGILTIRVAELPSDFVGNPDYLIPDWETETRWGTSKTLFRWERDGVRLPRFNFAFLHIQALCPSDSLSSPKDGYCSETVKEDYNPDVCPSGYEQVAYDKCCQISDLDVCVFADGSLVDLTPPPTASPSLAPTVSPTAQPVAAPTASPSAQPATPTASPSAQPVSPTASPTAQPVAAPTANPTTQPVAAPTANPTAQPVAAPTANPTAQPVAAPTVNPSTQPVAAPTASPTAQPVAAPTVSPTAQPVAAPTANPTAQPVTQTTSPSISPTASPTAQPVTRTTSAPTICTPGTNTCINTATAGTDCGCSATFPVCSLRWNLEPAEGDPGKFCRKCIDDKDWNQVDTGCSPSKPNCDKKDCI